MGRHADLILRDTACCIINARHDRTGGEDVRALADSALGIHIFGV